MIKLLLLFVVSSFLTLIVNGQQAPKNSGRSPKKSTRKAKVPGAETRTNLNPSKNNEQDTAISILVEIESNKVFQQIRADKSGFYALTKVPDTIIINFPNPFNEYSVRFNKDGKKSFKLDFSKSKDDDSSVYVDERWLMSGQLKLVFQRNDLIGIAGRPNPIKGKSFKLESGKAYISIIDNSKQKKGKEKSMYDTLLSTKPQRDLKVDENEIRKYKFFCGNLQCPNCDTPGKTNMCSGRFVCSDSVKDLYNQVFERPNYYYSSIPENKVSAKYWVVVDYRNFKDGKKPLVTYLKCKKRKSDTADWTIQKQISPTARKQAVYTVIGPADSTYIIDSSEKQYFLEDESQVSKTLDGLKPGTNTNNDTNKKSDSDATKQIKVQENQIRYEQKDKLIEYLNKYFLKKERSNIINLIDSLNNLYSKELELSNDTILLLKHKIDSLTKLYDSLYLEEAKRLKEKYLALDRDIEKFNGQYGDISFRYAAYQADLLCMQLKMKELLQIPVTSNAQDLAQSLINLVVTSGVDTAYWGGFSNLIKAIEAAYGAALNKKPKYKLFSASLQIPNTDEFATKIKTANATDYFYNETFKTSWGFKIDFSTGIFLNGLANPSYVLGQHTFRYGLGKDTVINGQLQFNSNGNVADTTGNLIQVNKPKISYSAGFLAHLYPRTGGFVDLGGVVGVTINNSNSSPLVMLAGLSCMFNMGEGTRISLVGGAAFGQVKTISSVAKPYLWNSAVDTDNKFYQSVSSIPSFYKGSSDIPTYDQWKVSWFFGFTYNFASVTTGKK